MTRSSFFGQVELIYKYIADKTDSIEEANFICETLLNLSAFENMLISSPGKVLEFPELIITAGPLDRATSADQTPTPAEALLLRCFEVARSVAAYVLGNKEFENSQASEIIGFLRSSFASPSRYADTKETLKTENITYNIVARPDVATNVSS